MSLQPLHVTVLLCFISGKAKSLTITQHHPGYFSTAPGQPGRVAAAQLPSDVPFFRYRAPVRGVGAMLASSYKALSTPPQILSRTMAEGAPGVALIFLASEQD